MMAMPPRSSTANAAARSQPTRSPSPTTATTTVTAPSATSTSRQTSTRFTLTRTCASAGFTRGRSRGARGRPPKSAGDEPPAPPAVHADEALRVRRLHEGEVEGAEANALHERLHARPGDEAD